MIPPLLTENKKLKVQVEQQQAIIQELTEALESIIKWDDGKYQNFIKPGTMWTEQIKSFLKSKEFQQSKGK